MIERTRQVAAGVLRPANSINALSQVETPEQVHSTKSKPKSLGKADEMLRKNSQKYEDLMKERKDELRRKRGALELNSDLDLDSEDRVQFRGP